MRRQKNTAVVPYGVMSVLWIYPLLCLRCNVTMVVEFHFQLGYHNAYSRNNMRQKCGGDCGLWVLNEIIKWKWAGLAVLFSR